MKTLQLYYNNEQESGSGRLGPVPDPDPCKIDKLNIFFTTVVETLT
jgi:hypothetical protein